MHADKETFTRRGFPVSEMDIQRAKVAARAAGQSLNVWVQRAIHAALETLPHSASSDDLSAPVAELATSVAALHALHQKWERQMMAVGERLTPPPPSTATSPSPGESGLADLTLS